MEKLTFEKVYNLCNTYGYFRGGSTEAYNKMFDLVRSGAPIVAIAAVIWACSPGSLLAEIKLQLMELAGVIPAEVEE